MHETLLHFIWKYQLFSKENLYTYSSEKLEVINPGLPNHDQGPDFSNAKIRIGQTVWVGNIEIHIEADDWYKHNHHRDLKYGNVILHIVYRNLKNNKFPKNIPHFVLENYISDDLLDEYYHLMQSSSWIPCISQIQHIGKEVKDFWKERMVVERLEKRYQKIREFLDYNFTDWEESFFQYLSRYFGFNKNNMAFENLAKSFSYKTIQKHKNNLFQIESTLFGQSGLINGNFSDEYPKVLRKEYHFLKKKYDLETMTPTFWNFSRMRPANFPTIRIAQLCHLLSQEDKLFSKIIEIKDISELYKLFECRASEYWNEHYVFDETSKSKSIKKLGKSSIKGIIINVVIPFIFSYGKVKDNYELIERSIDLLCQIEPEKNSILEKWKKLGLENQNASDSQALLYLKKEYCNLKRCLDCQIGTHILNRK